MANSLPYIAVALAGYQGEPWKEWRVGKNDVKEIGLGNGIPGFLYLEITIEGKNTPEDGKAPDQKLRFMACPATLVLEVGPPEIIPDAPTILVPGRPRIQEPTI